MAIKSNGDRTVFTVFSRPTAPFPIVFANLSTTTQFGFMIVAKALNTTVPETVFAYIGTDGSKISIEMDGTNWRFRYRKAGVLVSDQISHQVVVGLWNAFYVRHNGTTMDVFRGTESTMFDPAWTPGSLMAMSLFYTLTPIDASYNFTFNRFEVAINYDMAICNVRVYGTNVPITALSINQDANQWNQGVKVPLWCTPLRTVNDLTNNTSDHIYSFPTWNLGHEYSSILPSPTNITMYTPDPAYMATQQCSTWVYALTGPGHVDTVGVAPATTVTVDTIFKSTDFFKFDDRGQIPPVTTPLTSMTYCAFPNNIVATHVTHHPLYLDANGVEIVTPTSPPFDFSGTFAGVPLPNINAVNMYQCSFGGQFKWKPAALVTDVANITFPHLYVAYTGIPVGVPTPTNDNFVGLFVIKKENPSLDQYNSNTTLKIPDPTIKTALIGE